VIEEKPKGQGFGKSALKAAGSLRYVPRFIDGEPVEVPGVLYKYTFNMAR
jgi:protein TonB